VTAELLVGDLYM